MREVYEAFGINAATIGYVEAHGTGTRLGDPIVPRMELPYRPGEDMCSYLDVDRAARLLGWRPTTSLDEGISLTLGARR